MEPIYYLVAGVLVGVFFSWLYAVLRFGPLPTPEKMQKIVAQAMLAVSNAAIIKGSGPDKAKLAVELLGNALVSAGVKLDTKLLSIIVEAVYQYGKLQDRPNIQ